MRWTNAVASGTGRWRHHRHLRDRIPTRPDRCAQHLHAEPQQVQPLFEPGRERQEALSLCSALDVVMHVGDTVLALEDSGAL